MDPLDLGVEGSHWGNREVHPPNIPSDQTNRLTPPPEGFKFEYPRVPIDWKKIASCPLQSIERRGDVNSLSAFLPTVALGDIERSCGGGEVAHPALLKAFRQAQLCSQYLIHCQVSMEKQVGSMNVDISSLLAVETKLADKEKRRDEKLKALKKESRTQRRLIAQYHRMLRKHNPDLAGRVVGHGDGSISLVEKGGGGVAERVYDDDDLDFGVARDEDDEEDDFYTPPRGGGTTSSAADETETDAEVGTETKSDTDIDITPTPTRGKESKSSSKSSPKSTIESPEGKRIRDLITEDDQEEIETFNALSPQQKKAPIFEAMRVSGEFDFDSSISDSEVAL